MSAFSDLLLAYLEYLSLEKGCSSHTVEAYRLDLSLFGSFLDHTSLSFESVDAYVSFLSSLPFEESTLRRHLSSLRSFLAFCYQNGFISFTYECEGPRVSRNLPSFFSIETIQALLKSPLPEEKTFLRDRAILFLLYGCGLRVSELVSLTFTHFSDGYSFVTVFGKGKKERQLPVHAAVQTVLSEYVSSLSLNCTSKHPFFHLKRFKPLTRFFVYQLVRKYAMRVGVSGASPHVFRHSFATHLLEGGLDLRQVQGLLGHASLATTEIYTHLCSDHLKETYFLAHPRAAL